MKSKAAIGNHPIHPVLACFPIGAFFLVLVGDIEHLVTADPLWYRFSAVSINVGILSALLAAAVGAVDYLGLHLEVRTTWIATAHALTNVVAVSLYAASDLLRLSGAALHSARWWIAATSSTAGFLVLGVGGWLGGKLVHEERVGVIEAPTEDRLAEEPGNSAGSRPRRVASAR